MASNDFILAFDTSNETIAIGLGRLDPHTRTIEPVATRSLAARRASNTKLLPMIDEIVRTAGVSRDSIACVASGRGPGSFTGVRICMATAKGIASALEVGLVGVSTPDSVAWGMWLEGYRGSAAVVADAMRHEIYPVRYELSDSGVQRLNADIVVKAQEVPSLLGVDDAATSKDVLICGDALSKYVDLFEAAHVAPKDLWAPSGAGLLKAVEAMWASGEIDPFDAVALDPAYVLPVYTRLSDAEENERIRLAAASPKNLRTGVQDVVAGHEGVAVHKGESAHKGVAAHEDVATHEGEVAHEDAADHQVGTGYEGSTPHERKNTVEGLATSSVPHDGVVSTAAPNAFSIEYRPLDAAHAKDVAALEQQVMGSDAWNEHLVADELPRPDRVWWAAYARPGRVDTSTLIGYAGGLISDGQLQILKIATRPEYRRLGIARELLARVASDARDLGAREATLEVRASNTGAQRFYEALGFTSQGVRPRYYSDREDAYILSGPLPLSHRDVAGMELIVNDTAPETRALHDEKTLILAIESSCDETASAVIDGDGELLSDVVASQIDFHSRFGGVVPEIASRKHIEAICGVAQEGLDVAARSLGVERVRWRDLSAIAVTYAPGLVGALVVGVAFAKGAAWGADIPFIGVNHMEGHLYANKIATPDIKPPMVVSLVSGGHTVLVHVKDWGNYETLGSTVDDAVGEAFDKVAKAMGLGYPGGPIISKLAKDGNPKAIHFPRAMMHSGDLQFSLSGLKTAVITYLHRQEEAGVPISQNDVAASFQQAVIDVQIAKARQALTMCGAREFCLGGGVAANPALRAAYERMCRDMGVRLTMPPISSCTDNAGMIALVALDRYRDKKFFGLDADAHANVSLDDPY